MDSRAAGLEHTGRRVTGGTDVLGGGPWGDVGSPSYITALGRRRETTPVSSNGRQLPQFLRLLTAGSKPAGRAVCLDLYTDKALDERKTSARAPASSGHLSVPLLLSGQDF